MLRDPGRLATFCNEWATDWRESHESVASACASKRCFMHDMKEAEVRARKQVRETNDVSVKNKGLTEMSAIKKVNVLRGFVAAPRGVEVLMRAESTRTSRRGWLDDRF